MKLHAPTHRESIPRTTGEFHHWPMVIAESTTDEIKGNEARIRKPKRKKKQKSTRAPRLAHVLVVVASIGWRFGCDKADIHTRAGVVYAWAGRDISG